MSHVCTHLESENGDRLIALPSERDLAVMQKYQADLLGDLQLGYNISKIMVREDGRIDTLLVRSESA